MFTAKLHWFRDHLLCSNCGSIPRERALMTAIENWYPSWRDLSIHESSPGGRGVSLKLVDQCANYSSSHYFDSVPAGTHHPTLGHRCENLEKLTFADNSFDIFITQDVMEHVFQPANAFKEIGRVLKPGGAHIFTVPIVNKVKQSEPRAVMNADGSITHLKPAEYHGNPVDPEGSLVTMDWGYDIVGYIYQSSGMSSVLSQIDNIELGIRAEYIDVIASFKY